MCGHYIPPLRMKSPVNLAVPCLQWIAKGRQTGSTLLKYRGLRKKCLFVNQHFQNWRPRQCGTRFCLGAKHIDDEIGGAYGTNG